LAVSEPLPKIAVLVSGEGTNLQALIDNLHGKEVEIVAVLSNKEGVRALQRAQAAGIETAVFERGRFASREDRDGAAAAYLAERGVELVVLAGYMELLTPPFLTRLWRRTINVHPALLPAFPGLRAIEQALAYGVKVFGVTVHFVDEGVDSGPVIVQRAVELPEAKEVEQVREVLRPLEHAALVEAVRAVVRGEVSFDPDNPRRVLVGGTPSPSRWR